MALSPLLRLECVTRQFSKTDLPAVSNVSLTLHQGELLSLLGSSGCGKTTLLRLVAGFEQPDQGKIELDDRLVSAPGVSVPPEQRSIGMVFQDFALFPHLTVADNIAFGLKQLGRKNSQHIRERVEEAIALVKLQGKENRYPHELSGGQQQRVALARALAPRPALILLDEPLSNLDVQVRLYLRQEVRDILKATHTAAIFVTHDQEEALSISDRVAVMRQGQIEQLGTPEDLYQEPATRFVAEFVTQANFLPTQWRNSIWETEVGCFDAEAVHCTCKSDWEICRDEWDQGELMIRQEDLTLVPDEAGTVVVRDRQFLGREYSYCLQTPSGRTLQARTSTRVALAIGSKVKLSVKSLTFFPTEGRSTIPSPFLSSIPR